MKKRKNDSLWLGGLLGVVTPMVIGVIFYLFSYSEYTLDKFVRVLWQGNVLLTVLSLCAVANLGIFFLFMRKDKYQSARGVIFATLLYAVAVLINKFR